MGDDALVDLRRHDDGVVELVLDRPEAMNAVSTAMARALTAAGRPAAAAAAQRAAAAAYTTPPSDTPPPADPDATPEVLAASSQVHGLKTLMAGVRGDLGLLGGVLTTAGLGEVAAVAAGASTETVVSATGLVAVSPVSCTNGSLAHPTPGSQASSGAPLAHQETPSAVPRRSKPPPPSRRLNDSSTSVDSPAASGSDSRTT